MASPKETKRVLPDHRVGYGSPAALSLRRFHPCRVFKWARRSLSPPPFRFAVARFSAFHSMPERPTTPLPTALLYCRMARAAGGERLRRAHIYVHALGERGQGAPGVAAFVRRWGVGLERRQLRTGAVHALGECGEGDFEVESWVGSWENVNDVWSSVHRSIWAHRCWFPFFGSRFGFCSGLP